MVTYKKHLSEPHFSNIKSGKKKVEGRLNKGSFAEMKKGDIVEWFDDKKRKVKTKIVKLVYYKTFEKMIRTERLKNVLPEQTRILNGVNVYYEFYTPEDEKKYGIVAIRIRKI